MKTNANFYYYFRFVMCVFACFYSLSANAGYIAIDYHETLDELLRSTGNTSIRDIKTIPKRNVGAGAKVYWCNQSFSLYRNESKGPTGYICYLPANYPTPEPTPSPTPPPKDCTPEKGKLVNAVVPNKGDACISQCRAKQVVLVQQCNGPVQPNGSRLCLGGWAGQFRFDGARCNGSENGVPEGDWSKEGQQLTEDMHKKLSPYDCAKKGMASGDVNGQTVCVRKDGTSDLKTSEMQQEEKTNPDGSKTKTTKETQTTDDGEKITKEEKETKQEFNPDGSPKGDASTSSGASEMDKTSYCKKNPNEKVCKDDVVNGECGKPFKCEGDVIACEATKLHFMSFCSAKEASASRASDIASQANSDIYKLGLDSVNGKFMEDASKAMNEDKEGNKSEFNINSEMIKQDRFLGDQCWDDLNIPIMNKTLVIPFSKLCGFLKMLGNLVVAISMLGAARIIFKTRG